MNRHHSPSAGSSTPRSSVLILCLSQPMWQKGKALQITRRRMHLVNKSITEFHQVFRLKILHTYKTAYTRKEKSNSRFCAHVGVDKLTRQLMGMEWAQSKYN